MVALFGDSCSNLSKGRSLVGNGGIYRLVSSVGSEAMGIGKSPDVLTVLGGKASCRRKFVLHAHLVDEHGSLVMHDLAIVASVAYAHDHSPVVRDEKPFLAEPPLFTTFNGVEFPAQDRPTRMVSGRASFKLAISLLSSKCDNRLFCVCFTPLTGAGDVGPICSPCYSKPIRSISRKRTQSAHLSPASPLHLLEGLEAAVGLSPHSAATMRYRNIETGCSLESVGHADGFLGSKLDMRYCNKNNGGSLEYDDHRPSGQDTKFAASPTTSSENIGEIAPSPADKEHLHGSSRSSSVTSMHYLSPTSATGPGGMLEEGGSSPRNGRGALVGGKSLGSAHNVDGTVRSSSPGGPELERFNETDLSGSSTGGVASITSSPVSSDLLQTNNCSECKVSPCSLSLRLSPSDSGSPKSGALTSESSIDNKKDQVPAHTQSCPLAVGSFRNSYNCRNQPPAGTARLFRPYATVGPCKVPTETDFQLAPPTQSLKRFGNHEGAQQASTTTFLERLHKLSAVSPTAGRQHLKTASDSLSHCFSLGTEVRSTSDQEFNSALEEISLEEEERSLQCIEVSLQEVSREVQRRKEELRSKRRRLLEDEARIHSIILQSSSWIESLSGRFSL